MELWFSEFHTPDVKHSMRVDRHLYSHRSEYQQIDIYDTPEFGKVLALDGNVMLTERDEFIYDEMITHVPMAVHPHVQDVLVIGAGDGGVVKEWRPAGAICRRTPAAWMTPGCTSTSTTPCGSSAAATPSMT